MAGKKTTKPPAGGSGLCTRVARSTAVDAARVGALRAERNYEALELYVLDRLMGR
jgi:hypothetical protein